MCITSPCPGWAVTVGVALYLADEIVFEPIGPVTESSIEVPDNISSLSIRAAGTAPITILGVDVVSSAPLVSVALPGAAPQLARPRLVPNPAAGPVRVLFALAQAGHARVSVIDEAGRRIRGLADGSLPAGAHSLSWDGRDESGRSAPPGLYFVRVESGSSTRVARLTRLW